MRANAGPDMMGWVMRVAIFSSGERGEGRGEVTAERRGDGGSGGDGGTGDAAFLRCARPLFFILNRVLVDTDGASFHHEVTL